MLLKTDLLSAAVTHPIHGPTNRDEIRMAPVLCNPKFHHIHYGGLKRWSVILNASVRRRRQPLLSPFQPCLPKLNETPSCREQLSSVAPRTFVVHDLSLILQAIGADGPGSLLPSLHVLALKPAPLGNSWLHCHWLSF